VAALPPPERGSAPRAGGPEAGMCCCKGHSAEFMLRAVSLVAQWERIQSSLPEDWAEARLGLRTGVHAGRVAALLGPLAPGRAGDEFRIHAARRGAGPSPAAVGRSLARLDEAQIPGHLSLLGTATALEAEVDGRATLTASWDALLETLPPDWSDLYVEIELASSDHLDPGALALAPLNPARYGGPPGFRFRCARHYGYGASPGMARRCLARLDEQGIPGRVTVVRALSDTKPVATQGPVWYVGGKVV
jgi:hypothetical protein